MSEPIATPFRSTRLLFLCEQDGTPERKLKHALSELFAREPSVTAGYLVRVSYSETPGVNVALALIGDQSHAARLVPAIGILFKKVFNATERIDIFFLSPTQLSEIDQVAKPFYVAAAST
ncbi:MAG: enhanced serine sensitivity protein SseB C-terminal domain-containing protein [Acidobacteriaceae bacterium]